MEKCATCGNSYDKTFEVILSGDRYVFDSFECAIQKLAPRCTKCDTRIIGHGVEAKGAIYCCAHCAEKSGQPDLKDRL